MLVMAASVLLSLLLSGCDKKKDAVLAFSHSVHVKDNSMACKDCHGKIKEGRFTRPGHTECKDCHEEWTEAKAVSEKTCGVCHKVKNLELLSKATYKPAAAVVAGSFVHTAALTNRCEECHGNLLDKKLKSVPEMAPADKILIRDKSHRSGQSCAACHVDMDPGKAPPNHDKNWTRRHGPLGSQKDSVCSVCHSEQSCRECHQTTMPESHNNTWRLKTHGIRAAWDRSRCQVCHERDSCDSCHSEVRPQSHNAAWKQTHCSNCHPGASTGTGCTMCHDASLDSHPDPHPAGWASSHCKSCHFDSPQAEQCKSCHGKGPHPNPHSAGWLSGHCDSCHPGSRDAEDCRICHGSGGHGDPHPAGWLSSHCNSCHVGSPEADKCKECHGSEAHKNPHPAKWYYGHCNSCHFGGADAEACKQCHGSGAHPSPHSAGWGSKHCTSCHAGSQAAGDCAPCHAGGSSVLVHQSFWPPVHNRFGDQANCFDCHQAAGAVKAGVQRKVKPKK
ncbi:MAG: hypothetical protein C0404_01450 [Verrucomicrobia bacterium]|nr:hypothetical protein [Verrucomicrobiota bacterium]